MALSFSLGTFSVAGCPPFAGVVVGERVIAVTALQRLCEKHVGPLSAPETVFGLLQAWGHDFPVLREVMADVDFAGVQAAESLGVDAVKIHAPVLYPRQIFCAGSTRGPRVREKV